VEKTVSVIDATAGSIIEANYGDEYIVNKGYFCGGSDLSESLSMLICYYKDCSSTLS
jgi:hypothetical protein